MRGPIFDPANPAFIALGGSILGLVIGQTGLQSSTPSS